jgi:hypothetical protein
MSVVMAEGKNVSLSIEECDQVERYVLGVARAVRR